MDLRAAAFDQVVFKQLQQPGIALDSTIFEGCTFNRCAFPEAVFKGCRFIDCAFTRCDLSLARLPNTVFRNVRFEDCKLVGVNWTEAAWDRQALFRALTFERCALNYNSFFGLHLKDVAFKGCTATEVDFREAHLAQAICTGTDFTGSLFQHTNLTGADFIGALNYAISPMNNVLKGARFSLPAALSLLDHLDIVIVDDPA